MNRKDFIKYSSLTSLAMVAANAGLANFSMPKTIHPLAITMWDFSWLERRWSGAGYEDWDKALDELVVRGYNAVRIDAFPHLVANNPTKEYTLIPVWDTQVWGSADINKVIVQPNLNQFIAKCKQRKIMVGLSCWYREDADNIRMNITGPEKMADNWLKTLDSIGKDGLLDSILYVDLCNEWPGEHWCPYFKNDPPEKTWGFWHTDKSMKFMQTSIEIVRKAYPQMPLCYSSTHGNPENYAKKDISFFDMIEHHIWMAQLNDGEYDKAIGYKYERFSPDGYKNIVKNYERVYNEKPDYWRKLLVDGIELVARSAKAAKQPLVTTECWGIVDFKDWPLLKWDIIKSLCELGVTTAAATGQWAAIATSNFCGPQFAGIWGDIAYHQRLTSLIKKSVVNTDFQNNKLIQRMHS